MKKTSIVVGTTIALALAAVTHAQRPAGITAEMIATALPLEGAPLAVPGPYKVESGPAFGSPGKGFVRLNFATSQQVLDEILGRVADALGGRKG